MLLKTPIKHFQNVQQNIHLLNVNVSPGGLTMDNLNSNENLSAV